MTTFFLFGDYNAESLRQIDEKRTRKSEEIVQGYGGTLKCVYALMGEHDLVFLVELPGVQEALQCSLAITAATGISITSAPAVPVALFDELAKSALRP